MTALWSVQQPAAVRARTARGACAGDSECSSTECNMPDISMHGDSNTLTNATTSTLVTLRTWTTRSGWGRDFLHGDLENGALSCTDGQQFRHSRGCRYCGALTASCISVLFASKIAKIARVPSARDLQAVRSALALGRQLGPFSNQQTGKRTPTAPQTTANDQTLLTAAETGMAKPN
jgi:hypothetical protein